MNITKATHRMTGSEAIARGPFVLNADSVGEYRQLEDIGVGLSGVVESMDAALVGPAGGNLGSPDQFLQTWMTGLVRQVTQVRNIDKLTGVTTIGKWSDEEIIQRASELTGKAELYGDLSNVPLASYNVTYERRTVVRFEQGAMVSKLEQARMSENDVSDANEKRAAVGRALDIQRNRVGFFGFNQPDTRCFGFLNDPNLPAYVNVAGGTWASKTFLEITADIRAAITALSIQSGGNLDIDTASLVLAIPLGFSEYMGVTSDFGNSVREWLDDTYPGTRVQEVPELAQANGGANVFYVYAERVPGDESTDNGMVMEQLVPTRFESIGTEQRVKGYIEDFICATAGIMVKRPWAVVRYSGI